MNYPRVIFLWVALGSFVVCAGIPANNESSQVVAAVASHSIFMSAINPPEDISDEKRNVLDAKTYNQWLQEFRTGRLVGLIENDLLQSYAQENRLQPSEQEVELLIPIALKYQEDSNILIIRQVNASTALSEKQKHEILTRMAADARQKGPAERSVRPLIQNWNIQRVLHKKYGGRLLLSSLGLPTAIDAVRAFMKEKAEAGAFTIYDAALEKAFWWRVADDKAGDGIVDEVKAASILAGPPWGNKEGQPNNAIHQP